MRDSRSVHDAQAGMLFVLSGPSGSGKTSLCAALLERCPDLCLSISATTRAPRPEEENGKNYYFIGPEEFALGIRQGAFLEHAHVHGNDYGTRKADVEAMRRQGKNVLLEIDWQGAAQVAERCPDACRIFILPPSVEELRQRLIARGQDDAAVIKRRVAAAKSEMAHADEADFCIVNEDFDKALSSLFDIYTKKTDDRLGADKP